MQCDPMCILKSEVVLSSTRAYWFKDTATTTTTTTMMMMMMMMMMITDYDNDVGLVL